MEIETVSIEKRYSVWLLPVGMLVVGLVLGGVGGYFYGKTTANTDSVTPKSSPEPTGLGVACTMEAMQCPDGSYVGRTGPNCEFSACPVVSENSKKLVLAVYVPASNTDGTPNYELPKANILLTVPSNGEILEDSTVQGKSDRVLINGIEYSVSSFTGTFAGLCPLDGSDSSCTYIDDKKSLPFTVRTWKNSTGIFALNAQNISLDSYHLDLINITKLGENSTFSATEVTLWKEILKTLETVEAPAY